MRILGPGQRPEAGAARPGKIIFILFAPRCQNSAGLFCAVPLPRREKPAFFRILTLEKPAFFRHFTLGRPGLTCATI